MQKKLLGVGIAIALVGGLRFAEAKPPTENNPREQMLKKFDKDKDGELSPKEREAAFAEMRKLRSQGGLRHHGKPSGQGDNRPGPGHHGKPSGQGQRL